MTIAEHSDARLRKLAQLSNSNESNLMTNIPNYISPENRKEVDDLMKDYREAETKEDRAKTREEINRQVTNDTTTARDRMN